jgi:hypothetical protein
VAARLGHWKEMTRVDRCWVEMLRRPVGQLGRCEGFGLGEEGGCGGLRWSKRPGGLGVLMG